MVSIVDYGVGNLKSLRNAFRFLQIPCGLVVSSEAVLTADKLVLPGVGAFGYAMKNLRRFQLDAAVVEAAQKGVPILGICLGMQLLFTESEEGPGISGLDLIPGRARRFLGGFKVPHVGWNQIKPTKPSKLLKDLPPSRFAYFVHSYYCEPDHEEMIIAGTEYGGSFASAVERDNIFGVQFHPEKSQQLGLRILKNFAAW